jgi:hypothetical protein
VHQVLQASLEASTAPHSRADGPPSLARPTSCRRFPDDVWAYRAAVVSALVIDVATVIRCAPPMHQSNSDACRPCVSDSLLQRLCRSLDVHPVPLGRPRLSAYAGASARFDVQQQQQQLSGLTELPGSPGQSPSTSLPSPSRLPSARPTSPGASSASRANGGCWPSSPSPSPARSSAPSSPARAPSPLRSRRGRLSRFTSRSGFHSRLEPTS